jgi:hypothetical protein
VERENIKAAMFNSSCPYRFHAGQSEPRRFFIYTIP